MSQTDARHGTELAVEASVDLSSGDVEELRLFISLATVSGYCQRSAKDMSAVNQKHLVGAIVCSLIALVIWVWLTSYASQSHQDGRVQTLRENRLTGKNAVFNREIRQWDYNQGSKSEPTSSNANDVALRPVLAVTVPDHHAKRAFLDTPQLYKACLLADAIVNSAPDDTRQFTREEFQLAERCMAYITGALDTLPGKAEIIEGKRYEFAFRDHKVLVGNAVDSFNRYVQAHPESANCSGAETLAIALVNDNIASWLESAPQPTTMPTKTHEQGIPSNPMR